MTDSRTTMDSNGSQTERALFVNQEERAEFIKSKLHLVNYVLARLVDTSLIGKGVLDFDDLYSSGVVGLIEAADHYDPNREAKFSTFAIPRIRGAILDAIRSNDPVSRLIRKRSKMLQRAYTELEQKLQRPATDEEVAEKAGMTMQEMYEVLQVLASVPTISMDETLSPDDDSKVELHESVEDPKVVDPRIATHKKEMEERLLESIKDLPERERTMMAMYYFEEMTFREIGIVIGVTESRVCQMHTRILLRLKSKLKRFQFV